MKIKYLQIAFAVAAFVCAALVAVFVVLLYRHDHTVTWDPLLVLPLNGLTCGALIGLGVGVLLRRPLLGAATGAVCLWPIVVLAVLMFLPGK